VRLSRFTHHVSRFTHYHCRLVTTQAVIASAGASASPEATQSPTRNSEIASSQKTLLAMTEGLSYVD
jgi:hypothetical protein